MRAGGATADEGENKLVNNADNIDIDLWRTGKPEGIKLMNEKLNKMVDNADNFDIDLWRAGRVQLMNEITRRLVMLILTSYGLRSKHSCTKSYFSILVVRQLERGQKNRQSRGWWDD